MKRYSLCTMIGNPTYYGEGYREYTPENLEKLKAAGVDTVLVNLAWTYDYIDAVTLEHVVSPERFPLLSEPAVVARRGAALKARIESVHACGMKALGLFGIPVYKDYATLPPEYREALMGASSGTVRSEFSPMCIRSPETVRYYEELTEKLFETYVLDGMLVYTMDELADVCDEDSDCPRCRGIPMEKRLPTFVNALWHAVQRARPGAALWWEPWELSASEVYLCMEALEPGVGVCCHSNLHEVYHVNHPDVFLRNVGMLASRQKRPFMVQMFLSGSGEELGPVAGYPCPRLVYEQLRAIDLVEGVTALKEYYGTAMPFWSVNEEMCALALARDDGYETLVSALSAKFSEDADTRRRLESAWHEASRALLLAPWDLSWMFRFSNLQPYDRSWYGKKSFREVMRTPWTTPAWESNRRVTYAVVTHDRDLTPHMLRDLEKRMNLSLEAAERAAELLEACEGTEPQSVAVRMFASILRSRRNDLLLCRLREDEEISSEERLERADALLASEEENAEAFLALLKKRDLEHYFPSERTREGLRWIRELRRKKTFEEEFCGYGNDV